MAHMSYSQYFLHKLMGISFFMQVYIREIDNSSYQKSPYYTPPEFPLKRVDLG